MYYTRSEFKRCLTTIRQTFIIEQALQPALLSYMTEEPNAYEQERLGRIQRNHGVADCLGIQSIRAPQKVKQAKSRPRKPKPRRWTDRSHEHRRQTRLMSAQGRRLTTELEEHLQFQPAQLTAKIPALVEFFHSQDFHSLNMWQRTDT